MRGVLTVIVAVLVLWVVDIEFTDGRYTQAAVQMMRPFLSRIGIHI